MKKQFKKCFIAAPANVDIQPLLNILNEKGIKHTYALGLNLGYISSNFLNSQIRRADFVCVIIPSNHDPGNVLYEIGYASGMGKPLLIIIEPGAKIAFNLEGFVYAKCNLDDVKTLSFHIDNLPHFSKGSSRRDIAPSKIDKAAYVGTHINEITECIERFLESGKPEKASEIEHLLAKLVEQVGYIVLQPEIGQNIRPDMAIWLNELEYSVGNPILVEIEWRPFSINDYYELIDKFRASIEKSNAKAGILIYSTYDSSYEFRLDISGPHIFVMTIREFVTLIANKQLGIYLLELRNRVMHSKG